MAARLRAGVIERNPDGTIRRNHDDEIWAQLETDVDAATIDPTVKAELKALLNFEKSKVIKYKTASAPFDIPSTQYMKFGGCIDRLKGTKDGPLMFSRENDDGVLDGDLGDGEKIEEIMMEIQKLFSLHKVTIHGRELKLKDFPDTADKGVPDKVPDIPAVLKIKYVLGKKELGIHWDNANPYNKTFVVRVEHDDSVWYTLRKTTKNSTKVDVTSVPVTNTTALFRVKVTVQTGEDNITDRQWGAMKGQTIDFRDEDVTINKYRMNPSHSLYPIDKFRLEICDKYKTIYDLFKLFPESRNSDFLSNCIYISIRLN